MEDQEAVLKRNLTKLLKDLEQGTVSKAVPEINDAMESNNVCSFSHVEGAGDNSKKKEDIVNKKSSVEPDDAKPPKKEVDIVSTTVMSNENTVKDTGSTLVATENDIPALEQVVNEDGTETNTGMNVEGSLNLNPVVHPTTAAGINQSNGINADLSNVEGSDVAIPGPSTVGDGVNPNGTTVAPDSVETLVDGATPDPKIVASGKSGPKDKKTAQTK